MAGQVKLQTSAGGGVVLDTATTTATDVTVKIPAQNCTLGVQGPAFSAYQNSGQSVTTASDTKVTFQVVEFDTASCFSSSRFTPTVAGYYQINGCVRITTPSTLCTFDVAIFKNGLNYKQAQVIGSTGGPNPGIQVTSLVYLNGSTDYVEIYVTQNSSGSLSTIANGTYSTYFNGALVRAA